MEMEQRREHRFKPNQTATVKVFGLEPGLVIKVHILDVSGNGMCLGSKLPVPCGTLVEIEVADTLAFGEICRCESGQDSYQLGVQVSAIEILTAK